MILGKLINSVFILLLLWGFSFAQEEPEPGPQKKPVFNFFPIYTDRIAKDNHFAPSGWMGDYGDIKLDYGWTKNPYKGKTCIKFVYDSTESQDKGWAGVFWQNPANNWGGKKGGFNLKGARKLTFWARGNKGNEKIRKFQVGGISGVYSDSDVASIGPIVLHKEWRQYTINLKNKDLSYISGGFCWVGTASDNPGGITFFLDEIKFE